MTPAPMHLPHLNSREPLQTGHGPILSPSSTLFFTTASPVAPQFRHRNMPLPEHCPQLRSTFPVAPQFLHRHEVQPVVPEPIQDVHFTNTAISRSSDAHCIHIPS